MALKFLNNGYFAGSVGIGTESPGGDLHVVGKTGTAGRIYISDIDDGASATDSVLAMKSATHGYYYNRDSGNLYLGTNDNPNMMIINSSGDVGIGTTAPNAKLEVIATRTGTPSNDTNIKVTDDTAQAADVGGSINFTGKYTDAGVVLSGSPFIRASKKNATTGDYGYGLKFGVRGSGSGTSNVAMTIDSDSNVGIGTTSPSFATGGGLQITNATQANLRFTDTSASTFVTDLALSNDDFYIINRAASGQLKFRVNASTEAMTIDSNGNVGIGTISPDNLLTIESSGDTILQINRNDDTIGGGNRTGIIQFGAKGTWGTNLATSKIWSYAEETFTSTANGTSLRFFTTELGAATADEKMIIDTNGNVGIGTTSPNYLLDVEGSVNNADIAIRINNTFDDNLATSNPTSVLWLNAASNNGYLRVHGAPANTAAKHQIDLGSTAGSSFLTFSPSGAERMRITSTGGISFGSTGTAYGTSGQILQSNGNASPTWIDGSAIPGLADTLAEVLANGNTTGSNDIEVTNGNINFEDSTSSSKGRAVFGNQSDLSIYHDSTNSYIAEGGVGSLYLLSNTLNIQTFTDTVPTPRETMATFVRDGAVSLYYDNSKKFETTSTGVTVTGGVTADNRVVIDGVDTGNPSASANQLRVSGYGILGNRADIYVTNENASGNLKFGIGGVHNAATKMVIDSSGQIQFNAYDSTNNTGTPTYLLGTDSSGNIVKTNTVPGSGAGPYLPLSAGASYPLTDTLHIDSSSSGNNHAITFERSGQETYNITHGTSGLFFTQPNSTALFLGLTQSGDITVYNSSGSEYVRFDQSSESVGIGTTSPSYKLDVTGTIRATGDVTVDSALLSNQENTDVDTGTETVASVAIATYTAAFFDFVIKKTTNVRSGTVYACHDGTNVEFTETSTQDLGDTSDVTLSVDISGTDMRLRATTTSDDWSIKSLIKAI